MTDGTDVATRAALREADNREDVDPVLAILGSGVVPIGTPFLSAHDLGVLRGDGVFEAMHVRGGEPWLLEAHLRRLLHSASEMDLRLPATDQLLELIGQVCAEWPPAIEGKLRLICTRGPEARRRPPTIFATITPVSPNIRAARSRGVTAVTASFGMPAGARTSAPWLLGGAKTLSYAMNIACLRWAARRRADEMLWISTDGYALEAPTSTLVWLHGNTLCTVPSARAGTLPGTTAQHLLARAGDLGLSSDERMIRPAALAECDGVWLASSVRGIVDVRSLDGMALPRYPQTRSLQRMLGFDAADGAI